LASRPLWPTTSTTSTDDSRLRFWHILAHIRPKRERFRPKMEHFGLQMAHLQLSRMSHFCLKCSLFVKNVPNMCRKCADTLNSLSLFLPPLSHTHTKTDRRTDSQDHTYHRAYQSRHVVKTKTYTIYTVTNRFMHCVKFSL